MQRGEIWWSDPGEPDAGSAPGYSRPVVIIQADWVNQTKLNTVVVASITSNVRLATVIGNVLLMPRDSGLPKPSVIVVTQLLTLDRLALRDRVGVLPTSVLRAVDEGLRLILDL